MAFIYRLFKESFLEFEYDSHRWESKENIRKGLNNFLDIYRIPSRHCKFLGSEGRATRLYCMQSVFIPTMEFPKGSYLRSIDIYTQPQRTSNNWMKFAESEIPTITSCLTFSRYLLKDLLRRGSCRRFSKEIKVARSAVHCIGPFQSHLWAALVNRITNGGNLHHSST